MNDDHPGLPADGIAERLSGRETTMGMEGHIGTSLLVLSVSCIS